MHYLLATFKRPTILFATCAVPTCELKKEPSSTMCALPSCNIKRPTIRCATCAVPTCELRKIQQHQVCTTFLQHLKRANISLCYRHFANMQVEERPRQHQGALPSYPPLSFKRANVETCANNSSCCIRCTNMRVEETPIQHRVAKLPSWKRCSNPPRHAEERNTKINDSKLVFNANQPVARSTNPKYPYTNTLTSQPKKESASSITRAPSNNASWIQTPTQRRDQLKKV